MKLSRNFTLKIHYIFDQLLPPIIRDSKLFMKPFFNILVGNEADLFLDFKKRGSLLSEADFSNVYEKTSKAHIQRPTDLNKECIEKILENLEGNTILEVGCGRGYLLKQIDTSKSLSAVDIVITDTLKKENKRVSFSEASVENLPFEDSSFDTVICTHTLEHVQDIWKAISELRRVVKKRLIVVVPCQRPYKYTFDLHLHFFPYEYSIYNYFRPIEYLSNSEVLKVSGDIYYQENYLTQN